MINNDLFGDEYEITYTHFQDKEDTPQKYRARIDRAIGRNIWEHTITTSTTSRNGFPIIEPYSYTVPDHFVRFDQRKKVSEPSKTMLHFYMYDYNFAKVLKQPELYIEELKQYHSVVFPDASQYVNMPFYRRICNNGINKEIGQLWQKSGVRVVVNATWSDTNSLAYCFEGLPTGCMIAISSMGIKGNPYSIYLWKQGYARALECLQPTHIIRYGDFIMGEDASISTYFEVEHLNRMHNGK
ncbi:MAG: DUF4417 domain-containing protein [Bacteroidales bacterium]|nr:DUF4417 domain-containing protein [Bacteroidales bacterium]